MNKLFTIILSLSLSISLTQIEAQVLVTEEKGQHLFRLSAKLEKEFLSGKEYAVSFAKINNLPVRRVFPDGSVTELQYIDDKGLPVYFKTFNSGAAITTGANELHPRGKLRLFITGKGLTAGVWDAGRIEITHPEYSGRIIPRDVLKPVSDHAMHVAGTIMAEGIDPAARGMTYEAKALGYDWDNDLSQMAAAAAEGLIISNHSYGIKLGWERENGDWKWHGHQDSTHDYRFGYYSNKSRRLDEIAFNAPFYSIVWSAGNDRNDFGDGTRTPDGPYNCIGPEATAKNVMAIGAINKIAGGYEEPSDVNISNFSSWGPADDGRIKPDFVAAGVNLYSTISGNSYTRFSGTSMAAPNAAGSMLLLQDLFSLYNDGGLMKSATLKALVIHTVNYTGASKGPDYTHGWGLLNTEKAARMIIYEDNSDFLITENTLHEDQVFEFEFDSDGTGSIIATIAWTDPPGTPTDYSVDPHKLMLINDLDMRIYDEEENEYFPWILDPEDTGADAATGDNFRDNVEKILIEQPQSGSYRLVVTHKNSLKNEVQDFSLVLQTRDIPARHTFYWIGENGNWNDPQSWSLDSGGPPAGDIPGMEDHVVFDANSFSEDNQVVIMSGPAYCYSFNWFSDRPAEISFNEDTLTVVSSFFSEKNNLVLSGTGAILFTGDQKKNIIKFPHMQGETITLIFSNPEGIWNIDSEIRLNEMHLMAGTIKSNDNILNINRIKTSTGDFKMLDIEGSAIIGLSFLELINEGLNLNIENTVFNFTGDENLESTLIADAVNFYEVNNLSGNLSIEGSNYIHILTNADNLFLMNSNSIGNLMLEEDSQLILQYGSTQNIVDDFKAEGQTDKMIEILSSHDDQAYLESYSGRKFCLEYLIVQYISVSGTSIFNAGTSSIIDANSPGWSELECDEVLFADFSVSYNCVNSLTHFKDLSSGMVESWAWDFDLQYPGVYTSDLQNPYFTYSSEGNYSVSLAVSDGVLSHENVKNIYIMENPLSTPGIHVNNNTYTSLRSAPYYQWFLDGQPIKGASSRSYTNISEIPGDYQVMISDGVCNMISDPLVVSTSLIQFNEEVQITVFPNPANDFIQIDGNLQPELTVVIELIDIQGRVMYRKNIEGFRFNGTQIYLGDYLPGLYFLKLSIDGTSKTIKLIKQ